MILIKDMEMPKGCASCFLKYGSCVSIRKRMDISKGDRWCPENYRHSDCPLIEVPEDVQPVKHGKWEVGDISYRYPSGVHYCSVCDYIDPFSTGSMHYCPNCGAKMDGEDNV